MIDENWGSGVWFSTSYRSCATNTTFCKCLQCITRGVVCTSWKLAIA